MAAQIVMDYTGDTRHYFNTDDTEALSKAEARFKMLTAVGFTAQLPKKHYFSRDLLAADDRLRVYSPANFRFAKPLAFVGRR